MRKRDAKNISKIVEETAGVTVEGEMELIDFKNLEIILVDNKPLLMGYGGKYYVSLYGAIKLKPEKFKVVVDAGATDFIMNGADIMKPGILSADPRIREGDFVYVTVESKDVPIAVGVALCNAEDMKGKGKAIKNLHHLKDKIWGYLLERGFIS